MMQVETLEDYLKRNNVSEDVLKLVLGHKPAYCEIESPSGIEGLAIHNYIIDASWKGEKLMKKLGGLERKFIKDGLEEKESYNFFYGILEAVQNAQEHGYAWKRGKKVLVSAIFTKNHYVVGIYSGDNTIDLEKARKAINSNKTLRFGNRGRGFFFMDTYSDMLYLNQPGVGGDVILIKSKKHKDDVKSVDLESTMKNVSSQEQESTNYN